MMLNEFTEYEWSFFSMMGKYFSRKEIIKEMDCQLYSNPKMKWYILYKDISDVKGFISLEKKTNYYYIDNFYVLPEERKKGHGKRIFERVMKTYKKDNLKLITRNEIAKKIFESYGFVVCGTNGRYFKMEYLGGSYERI